MSVIYNPNVVIIITTLLFGAILLTILWMFVPESEKRLGKLRRCKSYKTLKSNKKSLEEYITLRGKRLVYRTTVEAIDQAISLIQENNIPVSREKVREAVENLYKKADFLEQSSEIGEKAAFCLMAEAMRKTGAAMEKVFVGELISESGGAKK